MARLFLNIKTSVTEPSKHSIFSIKLFISNNELANYQSFYEEITCNELAAIPNAIETNGIGFKR